MTWSEFQVLASLSRSFRHALLQERTKETVYTRFIPGYKSALERRDRRTWEDVIRLDYSDLALLSKFFCHVPIPVLFISIIN